MSLFERIRWDEGSGFTWLDRHLGRLGDSAAYFGFRYDEHAAREALHAAIAGEIDSCAVRLEIDRFGEISAIVDARALQPAHWSPSDAGDPLICEVDHDPVASGSVYRFHKTTARGPYTERRETHGSIDEVLMVNERGEVTEGTRHNVAVKFADVWVTPPLASGCMPGVLRAALIDDGVLIEEVLMIEDLDAADGVALLDSVGGWRSARFAGR